MKKVNINKLRSSFVEGATELTDAYERISDSLKGTSHEQKDLSKLASSTFLSLYVRFEVFLSDLFLAYLNRDFSRYQKSLSRRIDQSIEQKFGAWPASRMSFAEVQHVPAEQLERIVDPSGWNLTFKSTDDLIEKANSWLAPKYRDRVLSLDDSEKDLVDTARAIRNYISHRSSGARAAMNQRLQSIDYHGGNEELQTGSNLVRDEGAYLKAVSRGERRLIMYAIRLKNIAGKV